MDPVEAFETASTWTKEKIEGAKTKLESPSPCTEWNVRTVINHLISGQDFFQGSAEGREVPPPPADPPDVAGRDPAKTYDEARSKTLKTLQKPGAAEKAGFLAGIAWIDQLIHGWDVAKATGQDTTMPPDLAKAAFETINGKFPADGSTGMFKKAVAVPDDAPPQDKLLGFTGRTP